jgi:hypothetical protein
MKPLIQKAMRGAVVVFTSAETFVDRVLQTAKELGYPVERTRQGLRQVDFGHKKLHEDHVRRLYPDILQSSANIPKLIETVAPGRPCTHKPMREILALML